MMRFWPSIGRALRPRCGEGRLIRHYPFRILVGPLLGWAVVFPLVFFRWSRSLWLATELWLRSNTEA